MADERYYRVTPRFWTRAEQKGWSDDVKLLALYLLTGPHRTTEGLFRLPKKYAQADLEWSPQRFDERLRELVADGFCLYDDEAQVLLLVGAMAYQACANPNMAEAAVRRLSELPETSLMGHFVWLAQRYDEQLTKRLPERFGEPQALPQAQAPSPGESPPDGGNEDGESGADDPSVDETFDQFWQVYPKRHGKKVGKADAKVEWRKRTIDERRRAYRGAVNLAKSDQLPKDPERFLKPTKGGAFPFDDWQEAASDTERVTAEDSAAIRDYDPDEAEARFLQIADLPDDRKTA